MHIYVNVWRPEVIVECLFQSLSTYFKILLLFFPPLSPSLLFPPLHLCVCALVYVYTYSRAQVQAHSHLCRGRHVEVREQLFGILGIQLRLFTRQFPLPAEPPHWPSTLFSEQDISLNLELSDSARLVEGRFSHLSCTGITDTPPPQPPCGWWGLNPGSLTCMTSTLLTEPSTLALFLYFLEHRA